MQTHWSEIMVVCSINYSVTLSGARDLKVFSQSRVYYVLVYAGFYVIFQSAQTCGHIIVN
jgi:hypothetical protein